MPAEYETKQARCQLCGLYIEYQRLSVMPVSWPGDEEVIYLSLCPLCAEAEAEEASDAQ